MQLAQVGSKFYRSSNVFSSSERLELMGAPPFRAVTQLPASNYVLSNCTLQSLWFWRANAWTFCSVLCWRLQPALLVALRDTGLDHGPHPVKTAATDKVRICTNRFKEKLPVGSQWSETRHSNSAWTSTLDASLNKLQLTIPPISCGSVSLAASCWDRLRFFMRSWMFNFYQFSCFWSRPSLESLHLDIRKYLRGTERSCELRMPVRGVDRIVKKVRGWLAYFSGHLLSKDWMCLPRRKTKTFLIFTILSDQD